MKKMILKLRYRMLGKKMNCILAAKNFDAARYEKLEAKYREAAKAYFALL